MVNYSQWHTERSSSKKVDAIEEINVLSGKMDELMKLFRWDATSSLGLLENCSFITRFNKAALIS